MKFYSTKNRNLKVDLRTAVLKSLPPDNGLYMPVEIPKLTDAFLSDLKDKSFQDIAFEIARLYLAEDFSDEVILDIVNAAINFRAPLVSLDDDLHVLELWHGPSLAFKDFGARFMAAVMSRLVEDEDQKLTILVATSGDTGGAVAAGFLGVENVEVIILYPSGKVSPLQEKQLTTLGQNITALEVNGTFDDCQALVKRAFLDDEVNKRYNLSSANSINIARLIPQSLYYFEAYKQLNSLEEVVFCVPSGNFGNLTAGLMAKRMGLPISKFIAATNVNDVVPEYLKKGTYNPRPSIATISNAMDVGAPSNFQRMANLYGDIWEDMKADIDGFAFDDDRIREAIIEIKKRFDYTMDPHGAVGYLAAKEWLRLRSATGLRSDSATNMQQRSLSGLGVDKPKASSIVERSQSGLGADKSKASSIVERSLSGVEVIILETAHPAKFLPVMNPLLGEIDVPVRLAILSNKKKKAHFISTEYGEFKEWLLSRNN